MEKIQSTKLLIIVFLVCLSLRASAKELTWEPVTATDWEVNEDTLAEKHGAIMIIEKIEADEADLINRKCYVTIYRRIRILNPEARKWGDVLIPYIAKHQKIENIQGRTLLRDGREIPLAKEQIFDKEIFTAEGLKIKQKSFSLPGLTDDCIIEYLFKIRLPQPNGAWDPEKEIPLLSGEYTWKFYRGKGMGYWYSWFSELISPNWLIQNRTVKIESQELPSKKKTEKVLLTVRNVPAFKPEPYSPPENVLQTRAILFYGSTIDVEADDRAHWTRSAADIYARYEEFAKPNTRLAKTTAAFDSLPGQRSKIEAAYRWLQSNVKNITYLEDEEEYLKNTSVDEVLERGYGTREEINYAFYAMLQQMGIKSGLVYVVDRDKGEFIKKAKYWQFHRILVFEALAGGDPRIYSPGDLYLSPTQVPWLNEGTLSFIQTKEMLAFYTIPFSKAYQNRTHRSLALSVAEDGGATVEIREKLTGQEARELRLACHQLDFDERREALANWVEAAFPQARLDSVLLEETAGEPVILKYRLFYPVSIQQAGSRLLLRPFDFLSRVKYEFSAETRRYPFQFDYAFEQVDSLAIKPPPGWKIEALPKNVFLFKDAGPWELQFKETGQEILVSRLLRLSKPYWEAADYAKVREFFNIQPSLKELTIVLQQDNSPASAGK